MNKQSRQVPYLLSTKDCYLNKAPLIAFFSTTFHLYEQEFLDQFQKLFIKFIFWGVGKQTHF